MVFHTRPSSLCSPRAAVAAGPRAPPAAGARCVAAAASADSSSHPLHPPQPAATAARLAAGALSLAAAASAGAARALARLGAAAPLGMRAAPGSMAAGALTHAEALAVAARAAGPLAGLGVAAGLLTPADALWSSSAPPPAPAPDATCSAAAMTSLAAAVEGDYLAISSPSSSPSSSSPSDAAAAARPPPSAPATPGPSTGGPKPAAKGSPGPGSAPPPLTLAFKAGAAMLPHPAKAERGGEDAYYIAPDGLSFGVADGVGGWGELGIDAGAYARELMANCAAVAAAAERAEALSAGLDPGAILTTGHSRTRAQGSATACILALAPITNPGEAGDAAAHVRAANLGDSGFLVVRAGNLTFRSPPQQHGFNFPFQLGAPGSVADSPADAELFAVGVGPGDVVVAGTDGLWDNVFPGEAADLASAAAARGETPGGAARALAALARTRAADPRVLSPFAEAAQAMGYPYTGGKMDDITVVVAYVAEAGGDTGGTGGGGGGSGGGSGDGRRRAAQQRSLL